MSSLEARTVRAISSLLLAAYTHSAFAAHPLGLWYCDLPPKGQQPFSWVTVDSARRSSAKAEDVGQLAGFPLVAANFLIFALRKNVRTKGI
jgi:hypothetical protein